MNYRKSALLHFVSVSDAQRDALLKIRTKDFMSSEESGEEIVDGEKRAVIQVKPLPYKVIHLQCILLICRAVSTGTGVSFAFHWTRHHSARAPSNFRQQQPGNEPS